MLQPDEMLFPRLCPLLGTLSLYSEPDLGLMARRLAENIRCRGISSLAVQMQMQQEDLAASCFRRLVVLSKPGEKMLRGMVGCKP